MWRGLGVTLGIWAAGAAALRVFLLPGANCPAITSTDALADARASAAWMARVQRDDGSYLYEYNIDTDQQVPGYNSVRHAGVTMALYQLAALGEPSDRAMALPVADRGLGWMQRNMIDHDGWSALRDPDDGSVEVGGNALMLAGLAQRRIATGDTSYDALMHQIGAFLRVMQQVDGSFLLSWLPQTGGPDPYQRSVYATGEAFYAMGLMARVFPNEGWDTNTKAVARYIAEDRDRVENQKYPPWADQWAAYGFAEMATWPDAKENPPLTDSEVTYVRSLAERFGFLVRFESQRTGSWWSDLIRGREARAAGMGTWVEGLDSLWLVAGADPRLADLREKIGERAVCSAGMLDDRQTTANEAASYRSPGIANGAWFRNGNTRMDDQQHALSGLLRSRAILDAEASR
jgi:hypothetical protein